MEAALWIFGIVAVIILLLALHGHNKGKLYDSLKPGDIVVGSGMGGYHVREKVLEKTDDRIRLSHSGLMSREHFLFNGELEYFSAQDWYFF